LRNEVKADCGGWTASFVARYILSWPIFLFHVSLVAFRFPGENVYFVAFALRLESSNMDLYTGVMPSELFLNLNWLEDVIKDSWKRDTGGRLLPSAMWRSVFW
jgi:hypothetical protein